MSENLELVYKAIEEQHSDKDTATRRQIVAGGAAALGSMGMLALAPQIASAQTLKRRGKREPTDLATLLTVAASAEALATVLTTVGLEKVNFSSTVKPEIEAAAREELIHFQVLTSKAVGAKPVTTKVWIPDKYFASEKNFLEAIVAGDQIFINAYLIGVTTFAHHNGMGKFARYSAEFMGAEAVHRAVALFGLGQLATDRAFMKYSQPETNPASPLNGQPGFRRITSAVTILEKLGFGFGKQGSMPGAMYDFNEVSKRTPDPKAVNTRAPR